jgi:hypothetical protein
VYETLAAASLPRASNSDLVELLRDSYGRARIDYLIAVTSVAIAAGAFYLNTVVGCFAAVCGAAATLSFARWEARRRTVYLTYSLDGPPARAFEALVAAFNRLVSCDGVWAMISSTRLETLHDYKRHGGASSLVDRSLARAGSGLPPWVEATVPLPAIQARGQTLYFLPNGIVIYDDSGVGFVDYRDVTVSLGSARFIEPRPPRDANIVDQTWLHPNRDGTADRRFAQNYQIPVCLYGEATFSVGSRPFLYLQTSREDVPGVIACALDNARATVAAAGRLGASDESPSNFQPWVEVNAERFQSAAGAAASVFAGLWAPIPRAARWIDRQLGTMAGEGNDLIHWFLRCLSFVLVGIVLGLLVLGVIAVSRS